MEAVTTQLAASGEFTLGAKVVFACNFSLAACGILLLLRRSKSRPSRSPFLVAPHPMLTLWILRAFCVGVSANAHCCHLPLGLGTRKI